MSDKTEEPTPKRLRKAREDGNSPLSTFASQAVAFLCAVFMAPAAVFALVARSGSDLRSAIGHAGDFAPGVLIDPTVLGLAVVALSAPILGVAAVTNAVTSLVQTSGVVTFKPLLPNFGKLDPISGFKNLFSAQRLVAIARAVLFGLVVAWIARTALVSNAIALAHTVGRPDAAVRLAGSTALSVAENSAAFGLFLGIIDIVITRRSWKAKLMMTKAEVKREHKESEGDPQQKAARERAHHEMLASVAIANVKQASVVVVNPTHIACALRYHEDEGDEAPTLVASGHGDLARKIVEAGVQYGIPVLRDVPLARALVELEVGDEIPSALYEAVAEILREAWAEMPPEGG